MSRFDEFVYVGLIFGLFVVPRFLERLYIPSAITAFLLGAVCTAAYGALQSDPTIALLATLGINSLFLFAGLETDLAGINAHRKVIAAHVASRAAILVVVSAGVQRFLGLEPVVSALFALALVTPSTGFILDSIESLQLSEERKFWVKNKAIATELLALVAMFVLLQAHSVSAMVTSTLGMVLILAMIPMAFRVVARTLAPHVANSEFGFFLTLAVLAGILTKELGAYYLVGSFVVGLSVQRFRSLFPRMDVDRMLHSLRLFSSFFVPFYFFRSGGAMSLDHFSPAALGLGLVLAIVVSALRIFSVVVSRRVAFGESVRESVGLSLALMPTLVFGLVIAGILRESYDLPSVYFGGLVIYTLLVTLIPGIILKNARFHDVEEPFEAAANSL